MKKRKNFIFKRCELLKRKESFLDLLIEIAIEEIGMKWSLNSNYFCLLLIHPYVIMT